MSARDKALQGVKKSTPSWEVNCQAEPTCPNRPGTYHPLPARATVHYDPDCSYSHGENVKGDCVDYFLRTTRDAFRWFTAQEGWTYDKDGKWICPKCSKGGEG